MQIKIGVVCEGSHDFNVIREVINQICADNGITLSGFDCLQPTLSATFDQVGGGGWGRVKSWCEANGGAGYRVFLDRPLFSNSAIYDLLLVHLDGDVLDICDEPPLTGISTASVNVSGVVAVLEGAVLNSWMTVSADHADKVVACIPVKHLEAWLLAALDPAATSLETVDSKEPFRAKFAPLYPRKNKALYQRAAADAAKQLEKIRASCQSFDLFEQRFLAAVGA